MTSILRNNGLLDKIVNISLLLICILGIATSFYMNLLNRSLWLDEAYLSYSFMQRNLLNMFKGELEYIQSAPLGWLYLVKIFTYIFGTSEFMLRMPSILFYIGTLILTYYYSEKIINLTYPLVPSALVANMPLMLRYSNEFKPYIADCFFVLLTLIIFDLYLKKRINITKLSIIWFILIWFSNPVCFFEGGLLISYFIYKCLIQKDLSEFKNTLIIFFSIITSFIIYYFLWLKLTANNQAMTNFWKDNKFVFFPLSIVNIKNDITLIQLLFKQIATGFPAYFFLCFIPFCLSFIVSIKQRHIIQVGIYFGLLLSLLASNFGFFPIYNRLWCFFYPIVFIQAAYCADYIVKLTIKENCFKIVFIFIILLVFASVSNGIILYTKDKNNTFKNNEEINTEIDYLYNNAIEDDVVYVRYDNIPGFIYKNGYGLDYLKSNESIKVIYGTPDYSKDIEEIARHNKVYVVSSHNIATIEAGPLSDIIELLKEYGSVTIAYNEYETPLYLFVANEQ